MIGMNKFMQKPKTQTHILVTAVGGSAGLSALRFLKDQEGVCVHGVDINPNSEGQYFAHQFRVMAPFRDKEAYARDLHALIAEWEIDIVVPTLDEEMEVIQDVLAGTAVHILASPKETLQIVMNKKKFYDWVALHMPKFGAHVTTLDKEPDWDAPSYFVKPVHGRGGSGCALVSKKDLASERNSSSNPSAMLVMETLAGREWTVDAYVTKSGVVRYVVPRERLVVESGVSKKGRTEKHEVIMDATRELISQLSFYGPICVQFIEDGEGNPKLLEVNARMSGGSPITRLAGADPMKCFIEEVGGVEPYDVEWKEIIGVGYTAYKIV
jgi:carbamoyl-phosphate synthase large subunit